MVQKGVYKTNKKGEMNINMLVGSALTLIVLVITVTVGAQILGQIGTTQTQVDTNVIRNESITVDTSVPKTLVRVGSGTVVVDIVQRNNLSSYYIFSTPKDYNVTDKGVITWSNTTSNNSAVNFTYTQTITVNKLEGNITAQGKDALKTYSDWFATIVVIVIAVVIIGLIIGAFAFTNRKGGTGI